MFDPSQLLGALLQGGVSGGGGKRLENAAGGGMLEQIMGSLGGSGGVGGVLGNLLGGGQNAAATAGGGLGGIGDIAASLLGGPGKGALSGGAMALVSALATHALQKYSGGGNQALSPSMQLMAGLRAPASEEETRQVQDLTLLTVHAMINAAKADGQVDEQELQRILGKLDKPGVDNEAREFVRAELAKPMDTDGLVAQAASPQIAAQLYTASLLAIEVDTDSERRYLRELAAKLKLDSNVVGQIHALLGVAPV